MVTESTHSKIEETKIAVGLLLRIRAESCDGKTTIPESMINDIGMNLLYKLELITELRKTTTGYYVGVTPSGRDLCRGLGFY
ncbi:MAG: hypothetical protein HOD60_08970 [Candidatus Nitrosopelagicus sp.]|nr:hypothetical protein [Candidatus Nitrosopelagicus sp.]